jgi:hypothetical protein
MRGVGKWTAMLRLCHGALSHILYPCIVWWQYIVSRYASAFSGCALRLVLKIDTTSNFAGIRCFAKVMLIKN